MIFRFCLYSVLKNLRFADPFLAIYLIELGFSYVQIGAMLGFEKLVTALLEIPSGYGADRWGRRTVLILSFVSHAVGMSLLAIGAGWDAARIWVFYIGLGIYGIGEAFRTGSHKAIMLDYLDLQQRTSESTTILGLARTFSKASSALAGVSAGALLFLLQDYRLLFWLSAVAAVCGAILIFSYPKSLEGEARRGETKRHERHESNLEKAAGNDSVYSHSVYQMMRNRKLWPLLLHSLIYESQVEVVLKLFLQPFLYQGLSASGFALPDVHAAIARRSSGSILVGLNELFRDSLGAIGAKYSGRIEQRFKTRSAGLALIYLATTIAMGGVALAALFPAVGFIPGLIAVGLLTFLQNLRRPIFVTALNEVANRPLRATILSIDSQTRSFAVAILLPLMGYLADQFGLGSVAVGALGLLLMGLLPGNKTQWTGKATYRERMTDSTTDL